MNIQRIGVERLLPAPYNPRKPLRPGMPGYRRLERSLREFDLVQPLVWNQTTGHLVSGHQRLEILKAKGVVECEVVVVELPLEKEKALNVALNNTLVGGDWDAGKLIDVVRELQCSSAVDAALTGFDDDDLRDLLFTPEELPADDVPENAGADVVRVQFEVRPDDWEALRVELDPLLAAHDIRVHVKLPVGEHQQAGGNRPARTRRTP